MPNTNGVLKNTAIVGSLNLASRGFGFVRDLCFGTVFGANALTDAFFVAFRIPNVARSLVAEGALTSAFVPAFASRVDDTNREQLSQSLRSVTALMLFITAALTLVGWLVAEPLVLVFAPGFQGSPQLEQCVFLLRILLPFICCVSMVAIFNGALNCVGTYGVSALGQITLNLAMITAILSALFAGLSVEEGLILLASFVIIGGLLQVGLHLPFLHRKGLSPTGRLSARDPVLRETLKLMLPAIFASAVYQITVILGTSLASLLPNGSISWLFFAERIFQLPLGVFSVALASVLLPTLAKLEADSAKEQTGDALRFVFFFLIPLSVWMGAYSFEIIALAFGYGAFDQSSVEGAGLALRYYVIALSTLSAQMMLTRSFIARKDPLTPAFITIGSLCVFFLTSSALMGTVEKELNFLSQLVWSTQSGLSSIGFTLFDFRHGGLALASSASATFGCICLYVLALGRGIAPPLSVSLPPVGRACVAAAIASIAFPLTSSLALPNIGELVLSAIAFGGIYFAVSHLAGSRESQETFQILSRIPKRRSR